MASVRKREWIYKGERRVAWVVDYSDALGKRRMQTFKSKKDADRGRLKIETEIDMGTHVAPSDTLTVREACDEFMLHCEKRLRIKDRMTVTTVATFRNSTKHIIARFGKMKMTAMTPAAVEDWLQDLCLTFKRRSVEMHCGVLKRVFALAFRNGRVGRNILVEGRVRIPERPKERIAIPTRPEVEELLRSLVNRAPKEHMLCLWNRRVAVGLALFCGMRRGEICGLDWGHINFDAGTITIRQSYSLQNGLKAPKTYAGIRDIQAPNVVLQLIRGLWEYRGKPSTGAVIVANAPTKRRMPPAMLWSLWQRTAKRAGLADDEGKMKYHFHALRHTAVSLLIAEGLSPVHIRAFIGHANVSTTMNVYAHLFPDDGSIGKGMETIANRLSPQQGSGKIPQLIDLTAN